MSTHGAPGWICVNGLLLKRVDAPTYPEGVEDETDDAEASTEDEVVTAARPRKGFALEDAERVATDMGLEWHQVDFRAEQLRMGMDVELEHGKRNHEVNVTNDDPVKTGKIAWAHLMEFPDYYDRLARMEQEGKAALAERMYPTEHGIADAGTDMSKHPKFVSINGSVYKLAEEAPAFIEVDGRRYRRTTPAALREADAWSKLPKGWTKDSAKKFWKSTTKGAEKHPVTERSNKKTARIDYELPENHPQLPRQYHLPVKLDKSDAAFLQSLNEGQGDPVYALSSRLFAYRATVASEDELALAIDRLMDDGSAEALAIAEKLQSA